MPGVSTSTSQTRITPGMMDVYNDLLGKNVADYNNVLQGYTQAQTNLGQGLQGVMGDYNALEGQVMNTLGLSGGGWGAAAPAARDIQAAYTQQQGKSQQQAINSGLGNSTVLASMTRGNTLDAARAYGSLGAQLAQTAAGYQAQIALAQQSARMQGLGMQSGLAGNYLGHLAGYKFANTAGDLTGNYATSRHVDEGGGGGAGGGGSMPSAALQQARQNADAYFGQHNAWASVPGMAGGGYFGGYGNGNVGGGYGAGVQIDPESGLYFNPGAGNFPGTPQGAGEGTGEGGPIDPYEGLFL